MKTTLNLILVCLLLICQQQVTAQSYQLGRRTSSFYYGSLYKYPSSMKKVVAAPKDVPSPIMQKQSVNFNIDDSYISRRICCTIQGTSNAAHS